MRVFPRFGRRVDPLRLIEREISRLEEERQTLEAERQASLWWSRATLMQLEVIDSYFDEALGYLFAPTTCRKPEIGFEVVIRGYTCQERAKEWERVYKEVCVDRRDAIDRARDARIACRKRLPVLERELAELQVVREMLIEERQVRQAELQRVQVDASLIPYYLWY